MYAVIRSGGKQYRVAPGDIVRVEKMAASTGESIQFPDVLAVSGEEGNLGPGNDVTVTGEVVEVGRADKILVFHFKRKKQYKKIYGHRQPFTAVRITEIAFDGQRFTAPERPQPQPKKKRVKTEVAEAGSEAAAPKAAAAKKSAKKSPAKKSGSKTSASKGKKK